MRAMERIEAFGERHCHFRSFFQIWLASCDLRKEKNIGGRKRHVGTGLTGVTQIPYVLAYPDSCTIFGSVVGLPVCAVLSETGNTYIVFGRIR